MSSDLTEQTCTESHIPYQAIENLLLDNTAMSGMLRRTHNWHSNNSWGQSVKNRLNEPDWQNVGQFTVIWTPGMSKF